MNKVTDKQKLNDGDMPQHNKDISHKDISLNDSQRKLAEEYIPKLKGLIYKKISYNQHICGFEYEDIFQEGCVWLCRAASTFNSDAGSSFAAYADKVILNGLKTYCRITYSKQKMCCNISDVSEVTIERISMQLPYFEGLAEYDISKLFNMLKNDYTGTARLGIEAIELKFHGYSITEIAAKYNTKPNMIGACIQRAVKKLQKNAAFTKWIDHLDCSV